MDNVLQKKGLVSVICVLCGVPMHGLIFQVASRRGALRLCGLVPE